MSPDPAHPSAVEVPWWRRAVVYQVYPRSFADGNGDGIGDVPGIRDRLPYLAALGVDAIWVSPWYPSPLCDGGYDVTDYRAIDPRFGDIDDASALIDEAKTLGIRVIVDLVPNHTSTDHKWFREALAGGSGCAARDRYHFRRGRGPDGSLPPNDWPSVFGGPAWTRANPGEPVGEWYLHLFDPGQPDLNWEHDEVRAEFESILRFWLDLGVGGFRVDVAHGLVKHPDYADLDGRPQHVGAVPVPDHPYWDRDGLHEIYRSWRAILDDHRDRMMVAEASVHASRRPRFIRADEFHQTFDFDLLEADWNAKEFAAVTSAAIEAARSVGSIPTWTLSNHDVIRHATRYGLPPGTDLATWSLVGPHEVLDVARGERRARAAALVTLALPGALYLYQGEELGLPEVWDLPVDVLDDPVWRRSGGTEKGRDGCRVPIPWQPDGPSFGFGDAAPWLPQPAEFGARSAASQHGVEGSTLELYRRAIALRSQWLRDDEDFELVDVDLGIDVFAFDRASVRCVVNMGPSPVALPTGRVLLASDDVVDAVPGDTAVWIRR